MAQVRNKNNLSIKFEEPNGVVGLGILAAMSSNNNNNNNNNKGGAILSISPRLTCSSPIPILSPKPNNKEEMEMCEEYTCVISHNNEAGSNMVKKREYFDDQFLGNNACQKKTCAVAASAPQQTCFKTADFLDACSFCQKQLHGLDIFMYRGEKAFCSSDCRCKQISIDEHKEKCGSGAMKSPEFSASPCSGPMKFSAGVAVT